MRSSRYASCSSFRYRHLRPCPPGVGSARQALKYHPAGLRMVAERTRRNRPTVTTPADRSDSRDSPTRLAERPKPTRAQRIVAFTFLGAFGLTMLTVVLDGLGRAKPERAPRARDAGRHAHGRRAAHDQPRVRRARRRRRTSSSRSICRRASSSRRIPASAASCARTRLAGGDNALPLTLVARSGSGGQLAARLRQGDDQKVFVVDVTVARRRRASSGASS